MLCHRGAPVVSSTFEPIRLWVIYFSRGSFQIYGMALHARRSPFVRRRWKFQLPLRRRTTRSTTARLETGGQWDPFAPVLSVSTVRDRRSSDGDGSSFLFAPGRRDRRLLASKQLGMSISSAFSVREAHAASAHGRPSGGSAISEASGGGVEKRILRFSPPPFEVATWLILPVVICLSQRLSHACVSMN